MGFLKFQPLCCAPKKGKPSCSQFLKKSFPAFSHRVDWPSINLETCQLQRSVFRKSFWIHRLDAVRFPGKYSGAVPDRFGGVDVRLG